MINKNKKSGPGRTFSKGGFTLLEILLVVGIIAILAGIVIVAINPGRQLAQARNTERRSDIRQIKSAMEQFYIDKGYYPASTTLAATTSLIEICDTGASSSPTGIDCANKLNLSELVPTYITAIPKDPQAITVAGAGYKVVKDATNKLITTAPQAELSVFIAIGTSTSATVASTLSDGLIAHYLMNDTNKTTLIDSRGGYTATGTYSTTTGKINGATSWSDEFVKSDVAVPSTYSMSFWAKCNPPGASLYTAISKDSNADRSFGVFFDGDYDRIEWWQFNNSGSYYQLNGPNLTLGGWVHVVGIWDSANTTLSMYVNGTFSASTTISGTAKDSVAQFAIGYEGLNNPSEHRHFYGQLDDVRIYNRVLTAGEISQLAAGTEAE